MTDPEDKDDADTRSATILSTAQDIRPLEEDVDPASGHIAANDPLANAVGRDDLNEEQSRMIASLAQDVRPLENQPDD